MLGSNNGTQKTFLTVGFGKIRQKTLDNKTKVDENTPGSVKRTTQSGSESWALEYDFIEGTIEKIFYKEDKDYGNSYEVVISDVEVYQLSFSETSQYCNDLLKKLPNINLLDRVKFTAYDFEDKDHKRKCGLSIEQHSNKITSHYEVKQPDGKWKLLHSFPSGESIDFKDKDECKIYFIRVKKFLRAEFDRLFKDKFSSTEPSNKKMDIDDMNIPPVEDDLPF
jgi:hypothetical protein